MLTNVNALEHLGAAMKRLKRGEIARISRETGLDPSYLSSVSSGKKEPGVNNFAKIARAMGEKADVLLGLGEPDPKAIAARERAETEQRSRISRRLDRVEAVAQALRAEVVGKR